MEVIFPVYSLISAPSATISPFYAVASVWSDAERPTITRHDHPCPFAFTRNRRRITVCTPEWLPLPVVCSLAPHSLAR